MIASPISAVVAFPPISKVLIDPSCKIAATADSMSWAFSSSSRYSNMSFAERIEAVGHHGANVARVAAAVKGKTLFAE